MPRPSLRHGLDSEVYQVVIKLLDDEVIDTVDTATVYQRIKRSNSSLSRKSKPLLEASIERVISAIQEVEASDEVVMDGYEHEDIAIPEEQDPNIMNRSIMRSMKKASGSTNGQLGTEKPKKRTVASPAAGEQRQSKRTKKELPSTDPPTHVSLRDIGGMGPVIREFQRLVMMPMTVPERYLRRGAKTPRGILLHGPPGCGKTMLAEAIAAALKMPFLKIDAPSIVSGMSGESEKALREHFEHAVSVAPCLMFIDEIDAITPKRETAAREMERRIVTQLLTCMDNLDPRKTGGKPVIVLAATNRPDSIDPALRRQGRFDDEINIGVPNDKVRERILRVQTRSMQISTDVDFKRLAKLTPGFVGADLVSLVFKASNESDGRIEKALEKIASGEATSAARDADIEMQGQSSSGADILDDDNDDDDEPEITTFFQMQQLLASGRLPPELETEDLVTMADFLAALPKVQPSSKREGFATVPDTTWNDIGALGDVRKQLQKAIVEPIQDPEVYSRFGVSNPGGVLLWGPPGCGKTLLAKAVANESKANFISVKGPELLNKFLGESERAVRQLFFRARSSVPCVIFFDELDALVPRRNDGGSEASARVVNMLLAELDGLDKRAGIYVIAATNRPEIIDGAMLRHGRLGRHIFVGLAGPPERVEILRAILAQRPVSDIDQLARVGMQCERFSGADLHALADQASLLAIDRKSPVIEIRDLEKAMADVKPSVSERELIECSTWEGKMP